MDIVRPYSSFVRCFAADTQYALFAADNNESGKPASAVVVIITAHESNAGKLIVGDESKVAIATASRRGGTQLSAGNSVTFGDWTSPLRLCLRTLYVVADTADDKVRVLWWS